jgi:hypothetical protein
MNPTTAIPAAASMPRPDQSLILCPLDVILVSLYG